MAQQSDCEVEMLCLDENIVRHLAESGVSLEDGYARSRYARRAVQEILDGAPFAKTYLEFRNGFRHIFSALMQSKDTFLKEAALIDRCLDLINYRELEEILTYDPGSEQAIDRKQATWLVLGQNEQWLKQNNAPEVHFQCLEKIIDAIQSQFFTSQDLVDFVFAATGARTMVGNRVFLKFYSHREEKGGIQRLLEFHTCFSQVDVPVETVIDMALDELAEYLKRCVQMAISGVGFQIV